MLQRQRLRIASALLALAGAGALAAGADLTPPTATAGGYRLQVERLVQNVNLSIRYPRESTEANTPQHPVYLLLAIQPPAGRPAAGIDGMGPEVTATADDGSPIVFRSYPQDEGDPAAAKVWRTMLMGHSVNVATRRLRALKGTLAVYPRADVIRLELPVAGPLPLTRSGQGVRVILRECKLVGARVRANLEASWPGSVSVSSLGAESPFGVVAVSAAGVLSFPVGGGSSNQAAGPDGRERRTYRVVFDQKQLPKTLVYRALVRSGRKERHPFVFGDIALPDTLDLSRPEIAPTPGGPPAATARLSFAVRTAAGTAPRRVVLVGLSRQTAGGRWLAWRWQEANIDAKGQVTLAVPEPGVYRVLRRWNAPPAEEASRATASVQSLAGAVTIAAGQLQTLPTFVLPGPAGGAQ